jgi:hypothetical protein
MFEAVIWSYKQNTKLLYHQFLRRNKKICDPLPVPASASNASKIMAQR